MPPAVLNVHRADRADALVAALGDLLAASLPDPLAPEVVAVPTRGMERWLTQRLSGRLGARAGRGDGVCANVAFPSPRRLVEEAVAIAAGVDPEADPWLPERAVWPLLEVVDASLDEPWLALLAGHVHAARDRRFATVRHIAGLFDRYAVHRPAMLRAWHEHRDVDAAGAPLGEDAAWQAELWRRLRERLATPSPAERLDGACARLAAEPQLVDLPPRFALFGLTRLPAARLDVLRALAAQREVHLFLLHPSPALWHAVAQLPPPQAPPPRAEDPTLALAANPLLASWGHDARELQLVLAAGGGGHADHVREAERCAETLLHRIQADVRADRAPDRDARPLLDPADESVRVHACHGRARQVEVLRDAILHLLQADTTLEPRDIVVMCPDIEAFAPLVHATFGAGELPDDEDDLDPLPDGVAPPDLRVRLADRALRQTNPVLGVVAHLAELAESRLTASQVLDLADREPVRRRFGFDDDDLARIEEWVSAGGIRWGLDASHREPYKLHVVADGTWRTGLDRVLTGVAMTEEGERLLGDVLPLDDVDSGAIDLAGRLAELVDRLQAAVAALRTPKPLDAWADVLRAVAGSLTATGPREAWQHAELGRVIDDVRREAAAHPAPLALAELRALLAERLQGRPTRANFRTGHLTVCTLMPMRSVPHRVVCLLGMDDGVFPRKGPRDGDDLVLADPHAGDRDARTEDRQLLLDAVMAATDRLVITYTGNDERTNAERPPAVPIGELLDVVDRTVRVEAGEARTKVVVRHPLQPFDPRNFAPGALVDGRPWSFDRVTLDGARALTGQRHERPPFLAGPLPAVAGPIVELDALVRFVEHPVKAFLRQRLGFGVGDYDDELRDALPVELDGLEQWGVGDRLVAARLAGASRDGAMAAERARGLLPPGQLGIPILERITRTADDIVATAHDLMGGITTPESVDVEVALPDGRTLRGTVPGVCGTLLRTVTYSRLAPKHRLALWVRWLALTATDPERGWRAAAVGRGDRGTRVAWLGPASGELALAHLEVLTDLHDRGLREPLPIACKTSAAYAEAARRRRNAVRAASDAWVTKYLSDGEDQQPEHRLVHGGTIGFEELLADPPRPDETWHADEDETRFGRYARRLWSGLLEIEQVSG